MEQLMESNFQLCLSDFFLYSRVKENIYNVSNGIFYLPSATVFVGSIFHSGKHIQVVISPGVLSTILLQYPPSLHECKLLHTDWPPESDLGKGRD